VRGGKKRRENEKDISFCSHTFVLKLLVQAELLEFRLSWFFSRFPILIPSTLKFEQLSSTILITQVETFYFILNPCLFSFVANHMVENTRV